MGFSSDQDGLSTLEPVFSTDYNEKLSMKYRKRLPEDSEK